MSVNMSWVSMGMSTKGRLIGRRKVKQGLFFFPVFPCTPATVVSTLGIKGRWSMIDPVNSTGGRVPWVAEFTHGL